jgi:hypothetical protein
MHSACHVSIFDFWSGARFSVARLTHAIEFECEAQFALSPANAADAVSIAAATRAVVVILIMVNVQIAASSKAFNFFAPPGSL